MSLRADRLSAQWRAPALALAVLGLLALSALAAHDPIHGRLPTDKYRPPLRARAHVTPLRRAGGGASIHFPLWLILLAVGLLGLLGLLVLVMLLTAPLLSLAVRLHLVLPRDGGDARASTERDAARAALRDAVERSLEELRRDPNARRAIIGVYRLMETSLERAGLERAPAEAPFEYLARTLRALRLGPGAPRRLTTLFERARFGSAELDLSLRDEAIACLLELREAL